MAVICRDAAPYPGRIEPQRSAPPLPVIAPRVVVPFVEMGVCPRKRTHPAIIALFLMDPAVQVTFPLVSAKMKAHIPLPVGGRLVDSAQATLVQSWLHIGQSSSAHEVTRCLNEVARRGILRSRGEKTPPVGVNA